MSISAEISIGMPSYIAVTLFAMMRSEASAALLINNNLLLEIFYAYGW